MENIINVWNTKITEKEWKTGNRTKELISIQNKMRKMFDLPIPARGYIADDLYCNGTTISSVFDGFREFKGGGSFGRSKKWIYNEMKKYIYGGK